MRRRLLCFALLALPSFAHAAKDLRPTRVDPAITHAFRYAAAHQDHVPPWFDARPNPQRPARMLPIVLRPTRAELTLGLKALLARSGVASSDYVPLHEGAPLTSGAYSLWINPRGFERIAADTRFERIAIDLPRRRLPPLDASRRETAVNAALRALLARDGKLLDGTGVTIADIDSGIYVQHPSFFRADAGAFAWIDVDGDGTFTPGKDGVDLDGDGAPEITQRMPAYSVSYYDPDAVILEEGKALRPELDFLYIDANGNGRRDSGPAFDESTPAYGEPLFVVDDANGNGVLDPSERLLRLGTSKIRAIYTDRIRKRGDDRHGLNGWLDEDKPDYTSHGTGVAGILIGGVWGSSKLLGLAPGAELLSYDYVNHVSNSQTGAVQWAIDQGANVILTEYGLYTAQPLDGSSEEELLLDAAAEQGIVPVNPAGNLNGGGKHQSVVVHAEPQTIELDTDAYFQGSQYVALTILEPNAKHTLTLSATLPNGESVSITDDNDESDGPDGIRVAILRERTSRGTTMRTVYLYKQSAMPMGKYAFTLAAADAPAAGVPLELYTSDTTSSWAYGVTFAHATDGKTVCHPATADRGLAVAAYTLHDEDGYYGSSRVGEIAMYSSAGPLIRGGAGIGIAAPDNPMSATVNAYGKKTTANYTPFGGTSGAGPHVAAAAALLRQAYPNESAAQLRARIVDNARGVSGSNERWGAGKLDTVAALGVPVGDSAPPTNVRIELPAGGLVLGSNRVRVAVDDDGDSFRTRWDLDYDGTPDTEWIEGTEVDLTLDAAGPRAIRVYVADSDGNVVGASVVANVTKAPTEIRGKGDEDDGGCGCHTHTSATGTGLLAALTALLVRRRRAARSV